MIAVANGDSLLPDVEDWMDRDDDDDEDDGDGGCVDGPGGNFVAFPQQAFRIMVRSAGAPCDSTAMCSCGRRQQALPCFLQTRDLCDTRSE